MCRCREQVACDAAARAAVRSGMRARGWNPIGSLVRIVIAYVILIAGAGTMMRVSHPVVREAGSLLHTVSMVDPAIRWTASHRLQPLAAGLQMISQGLPIERWSGLAVTDAIDPADGCSAALR